MIPTVQQVYDAARSVLGDDQVSGGEVFTNTILQPKYVFAYAELFRALENSQNPRVRREAYYDVPINTGYLAPATAGIANLGEIESIEERAINSTWSISAVTPGSALATVTTSTTNTLVTGNQPVIYGVQGVTEDVNDIWTITVLSGTQFRINGCTATGTYTSGGTVSYSTEEFTELVPVPRLDFIDISPVQAFQRYAWETDIIRLPPCSTVRQLRIVYTLSGSAPTTTTASTGIDDCLDFFMNRVAGLAAESKGMLERARIYNNRSVGPEWETNNNAGGVLAQMLSAGVRNLQRLPPAQRRAPAFGGRRRYGWIW